MILVPNLTALLATRFKEDGGNLRARNDVSVEGFWRAMKSSANVEDKKSSCIPISDNHDGSVPTEYLDSGWRGFDTLERDIRGNRIVCAMEEACVRECRVACAIVRDDPRWFAKERR